MLELAFSSWLQYNYCSSYQYISVQGKKNRETVYHIYPSYLSGKAKAFPVPSADFHLGILDQTIYDQC